SAACGATVWSAPPPTPALLPKIVPHSCLVLYAPYPAQSAVPATPPISAPLPAPLPPPAIAPPIAPRPAPPSAPIRPGFAIFIARWPPVLQSAATVCTAAGRTTAGRVATAG